MTRAELEQYFRLEFELEERGRLDPTDAVETPRWDEYQALKETFERTFQDYGEGLIMDELHHCEKRRAAAEEAAQNYHAAWQDAAVYWLARSARRKQILEWIETQIESRPYGDPETGLQIRNLIRWWRAEERP